MSKKQRKLKKLYPKVYNTFVIGQNFTRAEIKANVMVVANRSDSYLMKLEKML